MIVESTVWKCLTPPPPHSKNNGPSFTCDYAWREGRINVTRLTEREDCCQDMLITYYTFKRYLSVARLAFVLQDFIKLALGDVLL